jgi:hypothetical protein
MFPYDPALLGALQSSPKSIDDVLNVMETMEAQFIDGDGLKWFNWLYLQVTQAVKTRAAAGGFASLAWLGELDVQFAGLYFGAVRKWLAGQPAPGCWSALLERRTEAAIARIQFALAGINAHINHDLPFAIVATCQATGTTPQHGSQLYLDYTAVNSTLDALVETAKQQLMVRLLGDALPPVSHLEDTIAAWSVSSAREGAWTNAEILWSLRNALPLAARYEETLDGLTTVAGKALLAPVPFGIAAAA